MDNWALERQKNVKEGVLAIVIAFAIFGCVLLTFRGCSASNEPLPSERPAPTVAAERHAALPADDSDSTSIWTVVAWCLVIGLLVVAACTPLGLRILAVIVVLVMIFCMLSFYAFVLIGAISVLAGVIKKIEDA